ncbi:MAG: hypothetical protein R3324_11440, partial [Halobacteriales archaeon]|nr:hypothetical protein [Halobacteriales archaeon]
MSRPSGGADTSGKSRQGSAWDRLRRRLGGDTGVAYLLILVLGFLNVLPMLAVLVSSFFAEGFSLFTEFTLRNWVLLFEQEFRIIRNT